MTTLAKIEANRRNAERSTGPRTAEGRVIVSRNATTHGIYSAVPVVPGECPDEWAAHRAGVVAALAPVGLLGVNLAERAALLLWRLARLARYEAETVASAMEDAEVPAPPPPEADDDDSDLFAKPKPPGREDQLRTLRDELRTARRELAEVGPARAFFAADPAPAAVPFAVAETILEAACARAETAEDRRSDPPQFAGKGFMRKLGLAGADAEAVSWTAELIRRGIEVYAGYAQESVEEFAEAVRDDLDLWAAERDRAVTRLEREAGAIARLLDGRVARRQTAKLLPGDGRDERIAKYERHLHGLLTSTLHELERLQARRDGQAVPPPAVADLNVTIDTTAD